MQATWLGYPGTTGVDFFDYALVDTIVAPPEDQPHFSERLVWLPESYQVNDDTQPIAAEIPTRAQCGLPEHGFVFCSFNAPYKIEPAIFAIWMRILDQVPDSVLWLFPGSLPAQDRLRRAAASHGIDPARLVFAPYLRKDQHLARHAHADLFLDTYFCNAHTTASDALWAGVPVLTCPGRNFAQRVAASLLNAIDLPELIAPTLPAYERKAIALARDPDALAELRARLAANRKTAPLFDTTRFARHLETAYRKMWELYERGAAPQAFAVPALPGGARPPAIVPAAPAPAAPSVAVDTLLADAIAKHQAGAIDAAASLYRQILAQQPDHAKALQLLGGVDVAQGRLREGATRLGRAADLDPSQPNYRYSHGVALQMLGDKAGAAAAYEATLRLAPEHANAHNNLGMFRQMEGRFDAAAAHFRRAIAGAPNLLVAHFNLANILDELGDVEGSIAAYRGAIALAPDSVELHYNLATTLHHAGKLDEALVSFERAHALAPTHLATRTRLALLRLQLCDWREADQLRDSLVRPTLAASADQAPSPFTFAAAARTLAGGAARPRRQLRPASRGEDPVASELSRAAAPPAPAHRLRLRRFPQPCHRPSHPQPLRPPRP